MQRSVIDTTCGPLMPVPKPRRSTASICSQVEAMVRYIRAYQQNVQELRGKSVTRTPKEESDTGGAR